MCSMIIIIIIIIIIVHPRTNSKYRKAGNFRGTNIRGSAILRHFVDNVFVVSAWIVGKEVGKVASFVGKIFVVRPPTTKTTNILPHENYQLYGTRLFKGLESRLAISL